MTVTPWADVRTSIRCGLRAPAASNAEAICSMGTPQVDATVAAARAAETKCCPCKFKATLTPGASPIRRQKLARPEASSDTAYYSRCNRSKQAADTRKPAYPYDKASKRYSWDVPSGSADEDLTSRPSNIASTAKEASSAGLAELPELARALTAAFPHHPRPCPESNWRSAMSSTGSEYC